MAETTEKQRQLGGITGRGFMPGRSGNPFGRPSNRGRRAFEQAKALASLSAPAKQGRSVRPGHEVIWYRHWDGSHYPTVNGRPISEEQAESYQIHTKTNEFREYREW